MNNAQSRFAIQHSFSTMTKPAIGRFAQHERGQPVRLTPCIVSGEAGIRTLGRLAPTLVFETSTIDHSVTSPGLKRITILRIGPGFAKSRFLVV